MEHIRFQIGAVVPDAPVHSSAGASQGVDAVVILGPDFDLGELESFTEACKQNELSSHVVGNGVAPIDAGAIAALHSNGLLGPKTHVFVLMHREDDDCRHMLVTQSEPQESVPTVNIIRSLRTGDSGAVRWRGLIHLMSCGAGQVRNDMKPDGDLWKAGQCLLYSGTRDTVHDPSQIADVLMFIAGSRKREMSAADVFAFVASRTGECTTLVGGDLREELVVHAPKSFDQAWEQTLSAQLLQQGVDAALQKKKARVQGGANDIVRLQKAAAQLSDLDDEEKLKRAARTLAARVLRDDREGVMSLLAQCPGALAEANRMRLDPLIHALSQRNAQIATHLITPDTIAIGDNSRRTTALIKALELQDRALIAQLLTVGANVNALDRTNSSALTDAARLGDPEIIEMLLNYGADVNIGEPLLMAASEGDAEVVQRLLDEKAAVDGESEAVTTPLLRAVREGSVETAVILLNAGANPSRIDNEANETALTLACRHEDPLLAIALMRCAPELLERENGSNLTPLMIAAANGHHNTVSLLSEGGVVLDRQDPKGKTALLLACQSGRVHAVETLLDLGADPDISDASGVTPLMAAAASDNHKIIELLAWTGGAVVDTVNVEGKTALLLACQLGAANAVEALLNAGADPTIPDGSGFTPRGWARHYGHDKIVALLEDHGAQ